MGIISKKWDNLSDEQKLTFRQICDKKLGSPTAMCETGEPMYMDEIGCLINTLPVIEMLFNHSAN